MLRFSASRRYANRKEQREHDGHDPERVPQCGALAECCDGAALDRGGDARGCQRVSAALGPQATARLAGGTARDPGAPRRRQRRCFRSRRCVGSGQAMAVRSVSTESGTSPSTERLGGAEHMGNFVLNQVRIHIVVELRGRRDGIAEIKKRGCSHHAQRVGRHRASADRQVDIAGHHFVLEHSL